MFPHFWILSFERSHFSESCTPQGTRSQSSPRGVRPGKCKVGGACVPECSPALHSALGGTRRGQQVSLQDCPTIGRQMFPNILLSSWNTFIQELKFKLLYFLFKRVQFLSPVQCNSLPFWHIFLPFQDTTSQSPHPHSNSTGACSFISAVLCGWGYIYFSVHREGTIHGATPVSLHIYSFIHHIVTESVPYKSLHS